MLIRSQSPHSNKFVTRANAQPQTFTLKWSIGIHTIHTKKRTLLPSTNLDMKSEDRFLPSNKKGSQVQVKLFHLSLFAVWRWMLKGEKGAGQSRRREKKLYAMREVLRVCRLWISTGSCEKRLRRMLKKAAERILYELNYIFTFPSSLSFLLVFEYVCVCEIMKCEFHFYPRNVVLESIWKLFTPINMLRFA